MSFSKLPTEIIIERILRTRPDALRSAARGFETAEDELFQVRGRMNGVVGDTHSMWDSTAGRSFGSASGEVVKGLGEVGYTLGYFARQLRALADAADQARQELEPFKVPHPVGNAGPYFQSDAIKQSKVDAIAVRFHQTEQRIRDALFTRGEQAPGALPVPELPGQPDPSWWENELYGPAPAYVWMDAEGNPISPFDADPPAELYGYDEDGNLVPAHRAAYPAEFYYAQQGGIPPVWRWITRTPAGKDPRKVPGSAVGIQSADEFDEAITRSQGWWHNRWADGEVQAPAHRHKHIREWFNIQGEVPAWAEREYLNLIRTATQEAKHVFSYSAYGRPTNAVMYKSPDTQKWIMVQFYKGPQYAGEYATSFTPSAAQMTKIFQDNALG